MWSGTMHPKRHQKCRDGQGQEENEEDKEGQEDNQDNSLLTQFVQLLSKMF